MSLATEFGLLEDDATDCIDMIATEVEVTRFLASTRVKGRSDAPPETTIAVSMSIQPLSQKEIRDLPEGQRNQGRVKAYGSVELQTVDMSEGKIPDRFEHEGVTYQVESVDSWEEQAGYFKHIAVRMNR